MRVLRSVKARKNTKRIFGFDIETVNENKDFLCANITDCEGNEYGPFFSKNEVIMELRKPAYRNTIIAASNLAFDFFGTFDGNIDIHNFDLLMRGSDLVYAKTYVNTQGFFKRRKNHGKGQTYSIWFIDTNNYARMKVEKLGKIIGLPKLEKPAFIGQYPKDQEEWKILTDYNRRDCEVSCKFLQFLYKSFENLGATPKLTIASTSMNLLKCKYLGESRYYGMPKEYLDMCFEAYYGGKTEIFARGITYEADCFDYISLYPSIAAANTLPDPNFVRYNTMNTIDYIMKYDGIAKVDVLCPEMKYPLLPFRYEGKTIFATGKFSGTYTNIELREALRLGYKILKVHHNLWFQKNCSPLKDFMEDMFRIRDENRKTPMEQVIKLLMNSLTGKFGQKYKGKENWVTASISLDELQKYSYYERIGDFFRVKTDGEPSSFCIPIWIAYITAIGRIKITADCVRYNAIGCDTDSIWTHSKAVQTSSALGDFKHEYKAIEFMPIRPKMYAVHTDRKNEETGENFTDYVKIKGVGVRMTYDEFKAKIFSPEVYEGEYVISKTYKKFTKFKEAKRRGLIPNELISITKRLNLNDIKRDWNDKDLKMDCLTWSTPLELRDGVPLRIAVENDRKAIDAFRDSVKKDARNFIQSDLFDLKMAGFDDRSGRLLFESERDAWKDD